MLFVRDVTAGIVPVAGGVVDVGLLVVVLEVLTVPLAFAFAFEALVTVTDLVVS